MVLVTPKTQDRAFKQELQHSGPPPVARPVPNPPDLPPEVAQFYLPPPPKTKATQEFIIYQARVLGAADVQFLEKRKNLSHRQNYRLLTHPPMPGQPINWQVAERLQVDFVSSVREARWSDVPESINTSKKLKALEKTFSQYLYDVARVKFLENRELGLVSQLGEDAAAFAQRCRQAARQNHVAPSILGK